MKKGWLHISVAAIALTTLAALFFGCASQEKVIKIGAILPLTGDGAKYGEEARNGIELALEETKDIKLKVIYEDDQGTTKGAVDAFNKLISTSKIPLIIGPMYSSTALAVAPLSEKNKVVVFSPSASSPELTKKSTYFFRNWPSDVFEGGEMANFTFNEKRYHSVAILSVNLDYGTGLTNVFKQKFESLGGKIISVDYYDQGATDFRTQLSKIKSRKPDAVYLPGYYAEIGLILKQAKEIGLKSQMLTCVGFDNPKVLEISGTSSEGVIFARPYYDPKSQNQQIKHFVDNFTKIYGMPPGVYAAHAYDALKITLEAIKKGGTSAETIKLALLSIKNYPGITGNTSFDENGDVVKQIQIMKVEKGEFINAE